MFTFDLSTIDDEPCSLEGEACGSSQIGIALIEGESVARATVSSSSIIAALRDIVGGSNLSLIASADGGAWVDVRPLTPGLWGLTISERTGADIEVKISVEDARSIEARILREVGQGYQGLRNA